MPSIRFTPADVPLEPYAASNDRLSGGAETRLSILWSREDGSEVGGVWEMTPGVLSSVQGNESFVIISGRARIEFPDGRVFEVGPGDAAYLEAGDVCRWTTIETLRKVVEHRSS